MPLVYNFGNFLLLLHALFAGMWQVRVPGPGGAGGGGGGGGGPTWAKITQASNSGHVLASVPCTGANFYVMGIASYDPGNSQTYTPTYTVSGTPTAFAHSSTKRVGSNFSLQVAWSEGVTGETSTFSMTGGNFESVAGACYSGLASSSANSGEGGCSNCVSSSLTSTSNYLLISFIGTGTPGTISVGGSWTMVVTTAGVGGDHEGIALAHLTATGGSDSVTFSNTGGGGTDGAVVVLAFH